MVLGGVDAPEGYADLVAERASRVPLQHLTGRAYFRGAGARGRARGPCRAPRPSCSSTSPRSLAGREAPVVVDLATGSGAIALAVKQEWPAARVYAVELTDLAHAWAVRNRDRLGLDVAIDRGDARHAYPDLVGVVDVVTCNPPYIPDDQVPVDPESGTTTRARPCTAEAVTDWGCRSRWRPAPRRCCATEAPSSWSTPTLRVPRCRRPSPARATGTRSSTTSTCWAVRAVSWRPVIGCEVVTSLSDQHE